MNYKIILSISALIIFFVACKKETTISVNQSDYFIKLFGGPYSDEGFDIKQTDDNGYILIGNTSSENDETDIILIKTDNYGNEVWNKTFGDTLNDYGKSVQLTSDGGYILLGTISTTADNSDMYLIKTDGEGNILWTNTIGGNADEEGNCVKETNDGGYILVGSTNAENPGNGNPQGEEDILLVKINANGDSTWAKSIGGVLSETGMDVCEKNDGYIVVGSTNSFSEPGQAGSNIIVIETNQSGIQIDKLTYGGTNNEFGTSILILQDGYIITGYTSNLGSQGSDIYCIKTQTNIHDIIWENTYGGNKSDFADKIIQSNDNNYIISGSTESYGEGGKDSYLLKINEAGSEIISQTYGGVGNEKANSVIQVTDGGFAFVGTTDFEENGMIILTKVNNEFELK